MLWHARPDLLSSSRRFLRGILSYFSSLSLRPRAMKPNIVVASLIGLLTTSLFTGCASIVSGRYADVNIDSYPSNAHVLIHDDKGRTVASLNTPGVVSLKRNRKWFLPARYTAVIDAPGYQATEVPIRSTINPWILGNVVIGGIPGLVVDNATGAAWRPKQNEIRRELVPLEGPGGGETYSANESPPDPSSLPPTP